MNIEWTQQAELNLQSILEYIDTDNPTAALELVDHITSNVSILLTDHPHVGRQGRVDGTRELVVHAHYIAAYRVLSDRVQILSVIHSARLWPEGF